MKTLLVPTDFSTNAENAIRFSFLLAEKMPVKIILMNAFQLPVPITDIPYHVLAEEKKSKQIESEDFLRAEYSKLANGKDLDVEILAVEGSGVESIIEVAEKRQVDYIVMGTKGRSNVVGVLYGSVASRVIQRSTVPVISIPAEAAFKHPIEKITYATDYHRSDIPAIRKVTELAEAFDALVNILHISEDGSSVADETALMEKFKTKVTERVNYSRISFEVVRGEDLEERLQQYINSKSCDMLVMSAHVRNFTDRIFGSSLTRHTILKAQIPIIAFHYKESTVTLY